MRRILVLGAAFALLGTLAAAADEDVTGREVAAHGTLTEIEGTLAYMMNEWFITTRDGEYELHMGPFGHADEPIFTENTRAWIRGFVFEGHIAPIEVRTDGSVHEFWTEQRLPLWAGSEAGGGRIAHENPDVPKGRREQTQELGLGDRTGDPPTRRFDRPEELEPRFRNAPPYLGRNR